MKGFSPPVRAQPAKRASQLFGSASKQALPTISHAKSESNPQTLNAAWTKLRQQHQLRKKASQFYSTASLQTYTSTPKLKEDGLSSQKLFFPSDKKGAYKSRNTLQGSQYKTTGRQPNESTQSFSYVPMSARESSRRSPDEPRQEYLAMSPQRTQLSQYKITNPRSGASASRKKRDHMLFDIMGARSQRNITLQSMCDQTQKVKTVKLDMEYASQPKRFSSKHSRNSSIDKKSAIKSPTLRSQKQTSPKDIYRKDSYNDGLNHFVDSNIETVAKLIAFKQNLENNIFDSSKKHQNLQRDVVELNKKNMDLRSQIGVGEETQRHLNMQVMQLERNSTMVDSKIQERYKSISEELSKVVGEKEMLKRKVNQDTRKTSQYIKEMEFQRTKSQDRVGLAQCDEETAKTSLSNLYGKMSRRKQVDDYRLERVRSKGGILKKLIKNNGKEQPTDDPKCYLQAKVSKIMQDYQRRTGRSASQGTSVRSTSIFAR